MDALLLFLMLFVFAHVFVMNVRHENTVTYAVITEFNVGFLILSCVSYFSLLTGLVYPTCFCPFSVFFPSSVPHLGVRVGSWQTVRSFWMWRIWCGCGSRTGSACTRTSRNSTGDWCRRAWSKPKTPPRVKTQSKRWEPDQIFEEKLSWVNLGTGKN